VFFYYQLKYTEVSVAKYESHNPNLIHNTVNYSIIDLHVRPEGKKESLVIILIINVRVFLTLL